MKGLLGGGRGGSQDAAPEGAGADETEALEEKEGNVLMSMVSQLRPGMDLSRITFPTFVLEPRSMLERITDFLSHPDLIFGAGAIDDPNERYIKVLQYYLAGWHIKPKGVKKPYNPVLGEIFRCRYHYQDGSEGFYIAEQVSHHPPISAFYYCSPANHIEILGELKPKSRFLGNSVMNEMGGLNHIILLDRPEDGEYDISMPNMYARGILFGKMVLELGDLVHISNTKNHIDCEVEFKTKGFFSGAYNTIQGKVKGPSGDIGEVTGKWSDQIYFSRKGSSHHHGDKELIFDAYKATAVKKDIAPESEQMENESRRLWSKVTDAIKKGDQDAATEQKSAIEDKQRDLAKQRESSGEEFQPKHFAIKHGEYRPLFALSKGSVEEQVASVQDWIFGKSSSSMQNAASESTPAKAPEAVPAASTSAPPRSPQSPTATGSNGPAVAAVPAAAVAPAAQPIAATTSSTSNTASKPVDIAGTPRSPVQQPAGVGSVPSSPETGGITHHLAGLLGRGSKHRKHTKSEGVSDDQASSRRIRGSSVTRNE